MEAKKGIGECAVVAAGAGQVPDTWLAEFLEKAKRTRKGPEAFLKGPKEERRGTCPTVHRIKGFVSAPVLCLAYDLGLNARMAKAILERFENMTDAEYCSHLDALEQPPDSSEQKARRRMLLRGLLNPVQEKCFMCKDWLPSAIQFCGDRGCAFFLVRPYSRRSRAHIRSDGGTGPCRASECV